MSELDRVLSLCAQAVTRAIPDGMPWRLLVIGSAATGEVTLTENDGKIAWISDVELYLESPDKRLSEALRLARRELETIDGPCLEISGASPERIERFAPLQWVVDIGNTARRIAGAGDDWSEPFSRFAGKHPGTLDAMVLLANRSADQLDRARDRDYATAKFALDAFCAALILCRRYRTGVGTRLLLLGDPEVRTACVEAGLDPYILEILPAAAAWKLSGREDLRERFHHLADRTVYALRRSVPRLLDTATGIPGSGALASLRRWVESRPFREMLRDWLRPLATDILATFRTGADLSIGPLWQARLEALEAFLGQAPDHHGSSAHRTWAQFAKGV